MFILEETEGEQWSKSKHTHTDTHMHTHEEKRCVRNYLDNVGKTGSQHGEK